ncbi:MAG: flagellar motor protein MotB, partial [Halocynthiibacter sp.]
MKADTRAPIIIKRKKVIVSGGHHGGAWKVAYADFVTAMMAFFLLMWLLNATTEKQRKGIADYFSPTIPVIRISGGGDGSFGGDSVFTEETLAQNGTGATDTRSTEKNQARGDSGLADGAGGSGADTETAFSDVENVLSGRGGESMATDNAMRHVLTRVTDEGLIVEIFDLTDEPLFLEGSATPTPVMIEIADMMAEVFALVRNDVAINGFIRSHPIVLVQSPIWNLSTARADQTRKLLEAAGLAGTRIERVSGYADRKPAARNPMAVRNNRLEL